MPQNEEGRKAYDQSVVSGGGTCTNPLTPYGEQLRKEQELVRQLKQRECELAAYTAIKDYNMKEKFALIAELFQMDVMSEDDALKACKTVIQQHAKKIGRPEITQ